MRDPALKGQDQQHASRRGGRIRAIVKDHPRITVVVVAGGVALAIFGFLWFRPDKLFANKTVDEALPFAGPAASAGAPSTGEQPAVVSTGSFRSLEHETRGVAKVLRSSDGRRLVRLENFSTSSGPDVVVILSDAPPTAEMGAFDDGRFVSLGSLKGNAGNQNYEIPANVDLSGYHSVVVWCRRFNVAFGAAPLEQGP
jgi:hypothetical protein